MKRTEDDGWRVKKKKGREPVRASLWAKKLTRRPHRCQVPDVLEDERMRLIRKMAGAAHRSRGRFASAGHPQWSGGVGSASRARDTGFDPLILRWSYISDLQSPTLLAAIPGTWSYRVSAGTGWSRVSVL